MSTVNYISNSCKCTYTNLPEKPQTKISRLVKSETVKHHSPTLRHAAPLLLQAPQTFGEMENGGLDRRHAGGRDAGVYKAAQCVLGHCWALKQLTGCTVLAFRVQVFDVLVCILGFSVTCTRAMPYYHVPPYIYIYIYI